MPARKTARHQARRGFRGLAMLLAGPIVAALVGGGLYLSRSAGPPAAGAGARDAALTSGRCSQAATAAARCARPAPVAATPARPSPGSGPSAAREPRPRKHRASAAAATPPASTPPAATAPSSPAPGSPAPARAGRYGPAVAQVLTLINQARAQAGLPAYTVTVGLVRSASGHTQVMAGGCGLSHQCPGEPPLGSRETNAGVHWTAAGENIGEAGPISRTRSAIAQAAAGLTRDMLNEKPPDDGHRLNILSSAFHHIGISVYQDNSGTVWMTQDFSS